MNVLEDALLCAESLGSSYRGRRLEDLQEMLGTMAAGGSLGSLVHAMPDDRFAETVGRISRETPTHYKWYLGSTTPAGAHLWLHQFKSTHETPGTFIQAPHNHRYTFVSLLLNGSYSEQRFAVVSPSDELKDGASVDVEAIASWSRTADDSYYLLNDEFHAISNVTPGTCSLVLQLPREQPFSFSVDLASSRLRSHYELGSKALLLEALARPSTEFTGDTVSR